MTAHEDPNRVQEEIAFGAAERATFFSDAVVAIAVTLLALNLPLPKGDTAAAILDDLGSHWPAYLAFTISFLVITLYWTSHHGIFRYVREVNRVLLRLNLLWLFVIILMPWLTDLLAGDVAQSSERSGAALRYGLYALGQVVVTGVFAAMIYTIRRGHLDHGLLPTVAYRNGLWGALNTAIGFAVSIPVFFVGLNAWILWIVVPTGLGLTQRALGQRRSA